MPKVHGTVTTAQIEDRHAASRSPIVSAVPTSAPNTSENPPATIRTPTLPDLRILPALYRLATLTARTDDPTTALRELLDLVVTTFGADAGSVSLLNSDTGRLELEVQVGTPIDSTVPQDIKPGHGVTGWCVLNRRSLLVPDVALEPRYIAVRPSARCEMAVPLQDDDSVIGVVDLESDRVRGFTPADLAMLEQLSAEAVRVLHRLWQLRHLKTKARQLESLITAGQSLVTKLEQQELFDTLTREACNMMQAPACGLYLHDSERGTVRCASLANAGVTSPMASELPLDSCLVASPIHTLHQVWFSDIQSPEFRELLDLPSDPTLRSVLASPMLFEGEVLGVVVIFTDRLHRFDNDEKRLCAALASLSSVALQNARLYARVFQSEDVLRKNERLTTLGLLAAGIAHEIRNPLTVLKLLHGGLGVDFPAGDPRHTDMRVIGEKLDQLEAIVTRVLGFAQAPLVARRDHRGHVGARPAQARAKQGDRRVRSTCPAILRRSAQGPASAGAPESPHQLHARDARGRNHHADDLNGGSARRRAGAPRYQRHGNRRRRRDSRTHFRFLSLQPDGRHRPRPRDRETHSAQPSR